jgi:threonine dehydrogenase-like Zn-dependent dehydrogenase
MRKMKAGFVKAPFQFKVESVELREIGATEVLVDVKACSLCGHDLIMASYGAKDFVQFGHEISGVVEQVGGMVKNVKVGDKVVLESGTFDRFSDNSRNGRVDLDNKGPNFWEREGETMGFAEKIIVPMEVCVKFSDISYKGACNIEPMGVALDLVKVSDIRLGDTVLVMGLGPIGLMAARLAKLSGALRVYATEMPDCTAKIELAKKWGVSEVFSPDNIPVKVDKVLVTAPPVVINDGINACNIGGTVAFLGIAYGDAGVIPLDTTKIHFDKIKVIPSHASPALYFPECIKLVEAGFINLENLVTHTFKLDDLQAGIDKFRADKNTSIKAVMIND